MKSMVLICRSVSEGVSGYRVEFSCVRTLSEFFDEVSSFKIDDDLIPNGFVQKFAVVVDGLAFSVDFEYSSRIKNFIYLAGNYVNDSDVCRNVMIMRCLYKNIRDGKFKPVVGINEIHGAFVDYNESNGVFSLKYFVPKKYHYTYPLLEQFEKVIMRN